MPEENGPATNGTTLTAAFRDSVHIATRWNSLANKIFEPYIQNTPAFDSFAIKFNAVTLTPPRYRSDRVVRLLAELSGRIRNVNGDSGAQFRISKAVAFGDFLSKRSRVQAPDVGIELTNRKSNAQVISKSQVAALLKDLNWKTSLVHIEPSEHRMSQRSHRKISKRASSVSFRSIALPSSSERIPFLFAPERYPVRPCLWSVRRRARSFHRHVR
jgi:hypothetical protein